MIFYLRLLRFAAILAIFGLLAMMQASAVAAQSSRTGAAFAGTVVDSSGAGVPEAKIKLKNVATNQTREIAADQQGFFRAVQIPPGTYNLEVLQPGFAPYRDNGIVAGLGETVHISVVLVPASASAQVTVRAQQNALDPSQTSVVSSIDGERIEELPVRTRNYLDFVLLAPGVASSRNSSSRSGATPFAGAGFTFGGLRSRSNNVSVDGLDNNDEFTGSSRIELSPEIVEEFQVVNNGLSAESGGASGGSINVITRSGSNTLHGDAFIFAGDAAFNARDPFESPTAKPAFRRFRIGAALGGAVVKNKTFYYVAAEQEHNRGQNASDIDPAVASAINGFLATGAFPRLAMRQIVTGFFPIARAETEAAGRLDQQLTSNTSLMLRYAFTNNKEAGDAFNISGLFDASARGSSFISDNSLAGSLTTVYGSQAVGDMRFQAATRHAVLRTAQPFGPEIDVAGLVTFGKPYGGNTARRENDDQVNYTYTVDRGKHLFKAGATLDRVSLRASIPDGFSGVYLFDTLNDFLAGRADQFRQAFGGAIVNSPIASVGAFVQDHWSLARQIALDAGVRYDFEHLPSQFHEPTRNVSPRVGLAWSPSSKLVFRSGYGIFFDRYVLANLSRAIQKNGVEAFEQVANGAAASNIFLAAQGGPLPAPAPGIAPSIYASQPRLPASYSQQASAGGEYLLARNLTFRADYLFVRGVHLARTRNISLMPPVILTPQNAASLGVPNPSPQQIGRDVFSPARANPSFDNVYQLENTAGSSYSGVSFTVERRMNEELEFSGSYTLSRAYDDASDFDEQPQNPFDLTAERALSLQNQEHRFVFNALWDLPIGDEEDEPQKSSENPGWLTRAFSHIEMAPIFTAGSGRPADPLTGLDSNRSGAYPLSSRPLGFLRDSLQTPSLVTLDLRLVKYFPFGEYAHLDLVAESFNLFNHVNISQINPVFGSALAPLADFGAPLESAGARRIQFSVDFEF